MADDPMGGLVSPVASYVRELTAERDKYRAALEALDAMRLDDFKVAPEYISPAFHEANFTEVMRFLCRTVNGALHNTDEYGNPLP